MNLDLYLFNLINGYAKKSIMLDFFAIFCAKYLGYILVLSLAIFSFINNDWKIFFFPIVAGCVSLGLNELVYLCYKRKRPMEIVSENKLIGEPISPAFPSSHTSFFFAVSFTLFLFSFYLAIIFIALSFLISLARIFCGVHWPSDIVGGICSAIISFSIIFLVI